MLNESVMKRFKKEEGLYILDEGNPAEMRQRNLFSLSLKLFVVLFKNLAQPTVNGFVLFFADS